MRKESVIIFSLSILISAGIVGTLSYLDYRNNLEQPYAAAEDSGQLQQSQALTTGKQPYTSAQGQTPRASTPKRLKHPQKCVDAKGNITFTDQPDCANAAPTSGLSIVESVSPAPAPSKPQSQTPAGTRETTTAKLAKKPTLHVAGVSPPKDTPTECKFPVGRALEIERSLSVAKDPAKSIWRKSYCRWIKEARQDHCEISREYFYYSDLCPVSG